MSDNSQHQPRVLIIDSSAILKSCFEGYPEPLSSSYKGRVMEARALYGYLYRTMKLYEEFEFEYMVHVMDPPGGSHYRYSIYPEYKAGRKEEDPTLVAQKSILPRFLEAFGERVILKRGIEADDLIASLAEHCFEQGCQTMIISPDKDLMQMVSDDKKICLARYVKDPQTKRNIYAEYREKEVQDVMGVRADQIADFLAIMGDSADNIPGVFKAGEKTAATWLNKYGDLLTLLTHANEITGKIGENLRAASPNMMLYQKLTSVLRNLPDVSIPEKPVQDEEKLALFKQLVQWPDTFPTSFGFDEPAAPAQAPHVASQEVADAHIDHDILSMPVTDPLDASNTQPAPSTTLGELFGMEGDDASPFGDLPSELEVTVTREVTITETVTVEVSEPQPSARPAPLPPRRPPGYR